MDYQAQDYQPYLQADSDYYELDATEKSDHEFTCSPPADWQDFCQGDWHCCLSPRPLAQQGWKIHLSVALGQEQGMLDLVSRYCFTHQLHRQRRGSRGPAPADRGNHGSGFGSAA